MCVLPRCVMLLHAGKLIDKILMKRKRSQFQQSIRTGKYVG